MKIEHEIFLSHSGKQKGFAKDLAARLSSEGYTVFFDQNNDSLPSGDEFPSRIFSAAHTCKLALVLVCEGFVTSAWPLMELCSFVDRRIAVPTFTILPLFFKLSPADLKAQRNVTKWQIEWERIERENNRNSAAEFKKAVTIVLPRHNGVKRRPESVQGEGSYIDDIIKRIYSILPRRVLSLHRYGAALDTQYVGTQRLCQDVELSDVDDMQHVRERINAIAVQQLQATNEALRILNISRQRHAMTTTHSLAVAATTDATPPFKMKKIEHEIFLSHSRKQNGFAKDLADRLSSEGYTVFFYQNNDSLAPGKDVHSGIFSAANTCKLALVLLCEGYVTSPWPLMELCTFVDRHTDPTFTILPLFFKLSPSDLTAQKNVMEWEKEWERLEGENNSISAAKCEKAVTKVLPRHNGAKRRPESVQGEGSYIDDIINQICGILPRPVFSPHRYEAGPDKHCVGMQRLCQDLESSDVNALQRVLERINSLAVQQLQATTEATRIVNISGQSLEKRDLKP